MKKDSNPLFVCRTNSPRGRETRKEVFIVPSSNLDVKTATVISRDLSRKVSSSLRTQTKKERVSTRTRGAVVLSFKSIILL